MELIYLDKDMTELGQIKNYKIDLAYGRDENNFELKTPENVLDHGFFWIIKGTEYGGVVDEIAKVSTEEETTYRGRSLQGILASFYCYQLPFTKEGENITVQDLPSRILYKTLKALELPFTISGADETEQEVSASVPRSTNVYNFLQSLEGYKLIFDYDKNITAELTGTVDYTNDEFFDATQYSLNISANSNIPNHVIGVYKKEDREVVKHLYFDENGDVQPYFYLDTMHAGQKPLHDLEYERAQGTKQISGLEEKVLIVTGGSTIENYDLVTKKTEMDGNTEFDGNVPADWRSNFMDYFTPSWDAVTGEIKFNPIEAVHDYKPITIPSASWWERHWGAYYKKNQDNTYTQLSDADLTEEPEYILVTHRGVLPADWQTNWQNYYRLVSTDVYQKFAGRIIYGYKLETEKGSLWDTNREAFYIYRKKYIYDIEARRVSGGKETTVKKWQVKDSLTSDSPDGVHSFAWYRKKYGNVFYTSNHTTKWIIKKRKKPYWQGYQNLKEFCDETGKKLKGKGSVKFDDYKLYTQYEKKVVAPDINEDVYRRQDLTSYPDMTKTYYEPDGYVIPQFVQGQIYKKIQDNYTNLITLMFDKVKEIREKAMRIEPRIDVTIGEFDVGDIVGGTHPFTQEQIKSTISKKIVRGDQDKIDITYEV